MSRDKLLALRGELNTVIMERREAIDLMLCALLGKVNLVFLGPPGEAKSYMVRELFKRITGANSFDYLLSKFTEPNELFGPIDIRQLEQGVYARVIDKSLATAHYSFLDEIWKANSSILNALLTILNEGFFMMDGQVYQSNLECTFGASNEMPEDMELLGALWDRFHLRYQILPVTSDDSLVSMWDLVRNGGSYACTISLDELVAMRSEVNKLSVGKDVTDAALEIKSALRNEGVQVTSRMWTQALRLVQARAYLTGATVVAPQHLDVLAHSWWDLPSHILVVQQEVYKIANPLHLQAISLEDTARGLYEAKPELGDSDFTAKVERVLAQLADMVSMLEGKILKAPGGTSDRAQDALDRISEWHHELAQQMLASMQRLRLEEVQA